MSLKLRLIILNFLQYYIWGAWLLTIGSWWFHTQHWSGTSFGGMISTMGIAALFMPSLAGIVADKWINAEHLYGLLHLVATVTLAIMPTVGTPEAMFWLMLINMCCYMPSISLSITVCYDALKQNGRNVVTDFPPIRVWGTVGFIAASWTVSLLGLESSSSQFFISASCSLLLGFYAFTLPKCPPRTNPEQERKLSDRLGFTSFILFKKPNMAVFFIFCMFLYVALQITNAYGQVFLKDFAKIPAYSHLLTVKYAAIVISISQFSETAFILVIPFFLKRFGIKTVMIMSMLAWALRFGLFAFGNPAGRLWMIVLSCLIYGMAFDFFNISGSLFLETQVDAKIRASAQGLFMLMTNGIGAMLGGLFSGLLIDHFFTYHTCNALVAVCKNWRGIWLSFAAYALVIAVLFALLFKYRHRTAK